MRSPLPQALCGVMLVLAGTEVAYAGDPTFACALTEGGKRVTITGTNGSAREMRCAAEG